MYSGRMLRHMAHRLRRRRGRLPPALAALRRARTSLIEGRRCRADARRPSANADYVPVTGAIPAARGRRARAARTTTAPARARARSPARGTAAIRRRTSDRPARSSASPTSTGRIESCSWASVRSARTVAVTARVDEALDALRRQAGGRRVERAVGQAVALGELAVGAPRAPVGQLHRAGRAPPPGARRCSRRAPRRPRPGRPAPRRGRRSPRPPRRAAPARAWPLS